MLVDMLIASGVRGVLYSGRDCLVARFMRLHGFDCVVGRAGIYDKEGLGWLLPADLQLFALEFDWGLHPALEEQGEP